MSHMIILLGLLQGTLDAGAIMSKQFLALHINSGKFTLLGSRIVLTLQTHHICILNSGNHLSPVYKLSFLN